MFLTKGTKTLGSTVRLALLLLLKNAMLVTWLIALACAFLGKFGRVFVMSLQLLGKGL